MAPILWMMDGIWIDFEGIRMPMEMIALLSMIPIGLYSGRETTSCRGVQMAFYLFYPVHLTVLYIICAL
jgi:hypothetical protein